MGILRTHAAALHTASNANRKRDKEERQEGLDAVMASLTDHKGATVEHDVVLRTRMIGMQAITMVKDMEGNRHVFYSSMTTRTKHAEQVSLTQDIRNYFGNGNKLSRAKVVFNLPNGPCKECSGHLDGPPTSAAQVPLIGWCQTAASIVCTDPKNVFFRFSYTQDYKGGSAAADEAKIWASEQEAAEAYDLIRYLSDGMIAIGKADLKTEEIQPYYKSRF